MKYIVLAIVGLFVYGMIVGDGGSIERVAEATQKCESNQAAKRVLRERGLNCGYVAAYAETNK